MLNILVDKYDIKLISTPDEDIKKMMSHYSYTHKFL
jgi:hydroxylamine reductase (hybrid-cluster protein)